MRPQLEGCGAARRTIPLTERCSVQAVLFNRATFDGDKWLISTHTCRVNGAREQLPSGSIFADQQYGLIAVRGPVGLTKPLLHQLTARNNGGSQVDLDVAERRERERTI